MVLRDSFLPIQINRTFEKISRAASSSAASTSSPYSSSRHSIPSFSTSCKCHRYTLPIFNGIVVWGRRKKNDVIVVICFGDAWFHTASILNDSNSMASQFKEERQKFLVYLIFVSWWCFSNHYYFYTQFLFVCVVVWGRWTIGRA